jgi:hypothetical protein
MTLSGTKEDSPVARISAAAASDRPVNHRACPLVYQVGTAGRRPPARNGLSAGRASHRPLNG